MSATTILINVLLVLYVIVCVLMTLIILMQRSKQEGLGASFGSGVTDSVFGAQTSQILVKTTVWLTTIFFVLTISLAHLYAHRGNQSDIQQKLLAPVPVTNSKPGVPTPVPPLTPGANDVPVALPETNPKPAKTK